MHQKGEQPAMPFEFEGAAVRVVKIDGEPWFVAKDVCDVLGYGNPSQALASHVDCDDLQKLKAIDSRGRKQLTNYINEPGLYALILCSEKQKAREFKKWVTGTVLPAISKDCAYIMGEDEQPSFQVRVPVRSPSRGSRPAARRRGTAGAAHHRHAGRSRHGSTSEAAGPPFPGRRKRTHEHARTRTATT
jgi:prophage antirepressor-like protein